MYCIVQARYSSKRLPGKVLKKINGLSILERVLNQVKKSKSISQIIVATSKHKSDKIIINFCKKKKINFFCGPLNDVFKRFYLIIKKENCESFIRITADSPLIDPMLISKAVSLYNKKKNYDIVTNVFPRTFPKGFSVEVINSKIILNYFLRIKKKRHKEHLTSFFYENCNRFRIKNFYNKYDLSNINLSIDNLNDFKKIKSIIKFCKNKDCNLNSVILTYKKLFYEK